MTDIEIVKEIIAGLPYDGPAYRDAYSRLVGVMNRNGFVQADPRGLARDANDCLALLEKARG